MWVAYLGKDLPGDVQHWVTNGLCIPEGWGAACVCKYMCVWLSKLCLNCQVTWWTAFIGHVSVM